MKTIQEIKDEFALRGEPLIIIDDGDFFIGSSQQLEDCFGIDPVELADWCETQNSKYEVII